MANKEAILDLARHAASRTPFDNYTLETVDGALQDAFREIGGSLNEFMRNRYDIYDIIIQTANEELPKRIAGLAAFCDIQQVDQGDKIMFRVRKGKNRARKFLTQVGLSGVYETFRLDRAEFTMEAMAIGGAATLDWERILDGAENMSEVMDILVEGLTDAVYGQIQRALIAAKDAVDRPAANLVVENVFDAEKMFKLISVVKSYGDGEAIIFATPEFVGAMGPDVIVPGTASHPGIVAVDDIDSIHATGYPVIFRGTPIVQIPQSFIDESNEKTWINPQFAYVLPAGKEKVVKLGLEGGVQIWDWKNKDQSMEIDCYRKMGVAILSNYNWGIYQNTGIPDTSENPYGV